MTFREQVRLDLREQAKLEVKSAKSAMRALELHDAVFNRTVDECESYATVTEAADAVAALS